MPQVGCILCHLRIWANLPAYVRPRIGRKLKERIRLRIPQTFVTRSLPKSKRAVTNRLWRYRTAQQLSQKHVARLLGHRNSAQVSRWENGAKTPTLDNALMLGHILKASVEALFEDRAVELQNRIDARTARTSHADDKTRKAS